MVVLGALKQNYPLTVSTSVKICNSDKLTMGKATRETEDKLIPHFTVHLILFIHLVILICVLMHHVQ